MLTQKDIYKDIKMLDMKNLVNQIVDVIVMNVDVIVMIIQHHNYKDCIVYSFMKIKV